MKYLKFMPLGLIDNASRNKRELLAAAEYGYDAYVYCANLTPPKTNDQYKVICTKYQKPPKGCSKLKRLFVGVNDVFGYMKELRKIKPDVVSCHNIIGLTIAYYAYLFYPKSKKPKFIYDSHEFELKKKKLSSIKYKLLKFHEGYLLKKCVFAIMICDGIASEVANIHKSNVPMVVVRSTPNYWVIDENTTKKKHNEFCNKLRIPTDSFIVMYHGVIVPYRGIEELLNAMRIDRKIYTVLVGDYKSNVYKEEMNRIAETYHINDRIIRYPIQELDQLWRYVGAADCGIVMNNTNNQNYIYALPNKFFENIQSVTPIICTNSIEMKRIVDKYKIGLVSESGNSRMLADNIKKLREDRELYKQLKINVRKAKEELCWEKEKEVFFAAFDKYLCNGEKN